MNKIEPETWKQRTSLSPSPLLSSEGRREGDNWGKTGKAQGTTCVRDTWTKTTGGRIEWGRGRVSRAGESNREEIGTTVTEQQLQ